MSKQQVIGVWTTGAGRLLLFAILAFWSVDISGLASRGELLIPLSGYLMAIAVGVLMQFLGAAIPNMRFTGVKYY